MASGGGPMYMARRSDARLAVGDGQPLSARPLPLLFKAGSLSLAADAPCSEDGALEELGHPLPTDDAIPRLRTTPLLCSPASLARSEGSLSGQVFGSVALRRLAPGSSFLVRPWLAPARSWRIPLPRGTEELTCSLFTSFAPLAPDKLFRLASGPRLAATKACLNSLAAGSRAQSMPLSHLLPQQLTTPSPLRHDACTLDTLLPPVRIG